MMTNLWKRYSAWCLGNRQFSPEHWAKVRAKGRGQFVLRQMFSYTVYTVAFYDLVTQFTDYGHPFKFGFYIFQFAFCGIWCGYSGWGVNEGKYKKTLKSLPQQSVQPQ
jgi:hypothetical protein